MRIINAKLFPMSGPVLERGYIDFVKKITGIGEKADMPFSDDPVLDACGASVYPGFIDAHTHLGMWEDALGFEGDDGNEDTDPVTPQLRGIDAVNPTDKCFTEALEAGVTTVLTGPGSANPVGGQILAMKTMGRRVDDMVLCAPAAIKFALGENPKTVYHGKSQAPVTRMATAALIREMLAKAQKYRAAIVRAQCDEDAEEPEFDAKCDALLPLIEGKIPAHFHAHRNDDIFTAIRIAKEFGLRYIIVHGTEGYTAADLLAAEGAPILCGPLLVDRGKPEMAALTPAAPGILQKAGVPIAIVTDHSVVPIQYLPLCAGLAAAEGLERMEALKAITIYPARICGIDRCVGSLEAGKDADMVLFDGDPLSLGAKPRAVFCNGKRVK